MTEIFDTEEQELYIMSQQEFFEKTKKLLSKLAQNYSSAWQQRALKDEEFPEESVCDKCTGCGVFVADDEQKECVQDKEQGWCYHRFCDYEQVGLEFETELGDIFDLLSVDNLHNPSTPTNDTENSDNVND